MTTSLSKSYRSYLDGLRINIGTKRSPEYVLNLNSPTVHRAILPHLQMEDPTLKLRDLRYYSQGKRQWCLYVRGKLWLRYDRHHGLSVYTAFEDYVRGVRDVVYYHLTHSVIVIHKFEGLVQNVYRIGGRPVRVLEVDYKDHINPAVIDEIPVESLPRNVVGKDVRKYLKESPIL